MKHSIHFSLVSFFLCFANVQQTLATHLEKSSHSIQFGGAVNTGNSETTNLNTKLSSELQHGLWGYETSLEGQLNTARGVESARSIRANGEVNYDFNEKTYAFGKGSINYDKFATYDFVVREAIGLGWIIKQTPIQELSIEGGPGTSHRRISGTNEFQNVPIANLSSKYINHLSKTAEFKQTFNADVSHQNTHLESVSAIQTKIIEQLALEISFSVNHDSVIPPLSKNTRKTDTASKVTVVYMFK